MNIYLLRHGETDWNKENRLQGRKDIPMNETGMIQIAAIGSRLSQMNLSFDTIVASPLVRAKTTAEMIARKINFCGQIIYDDCFLERSFGAAEGMLWTSELDLSDESYGAETITALCQRADAGIRNYITPENKNLLVVAHGAILQAVIVSLTSGSIPYDDKNILAKQGNILWGRLDKNGYVEHFEYLF